MGRAEGSEELSRESRESWKRAGERRQDVTVCMCVCVCDLTA